MAKGCKHNNVKFPASKPHSARADGKLKRCNEAQTQNRTDSQQLLGWRKLEADDSKLCATELRAYIPDIR